MQHGHGGLEHLHLVIGDFGVDADAAGPDEGEIDPVNVFLTFSSSLVLFSFLATEESVQVLI